MKLKCPEENACKSPDNNINSDSTTTSKMKNGGGVTGASPEPSSLHAECSVDTQSTHASASNSTHTSTTAAAANCYEDDDGGVPMSICYVTSPLGQIHKLQFYTQNCQMEIITAKKRRIPQYVNDKYAGPNSTSKFVDKYDIKCARFHYYKKEFTIDTKNDNKVNRMSKTMPPLNDKPPSAQYQRRKTNVVATSTTSNMTSYIYCRLPKGVLIRVKTPKIIVKQIREYRDYCSVGAPTANTGGGGGKTSPSAEDHDQTRRDDTEVEKMKNKANLFVTIHGDFVRLSFDLHKIRVTQTFPTRSIATSTKEDRIYLRYYGDLCQRNVYISVPRSTYYYEDPLKQKRRLDLMDRLHGREPSWVTKDRMKKEKIAKDKIGKNEKAVQIMRESSGSLIYFEADTSTVKSKTGICNGSLEDGESNYEDIVVDRQKRMERERNATNRKPQVNEFSAEKPREFDVPDWNLQDNEN